MDIFQQQCRSGCPPSPAPPQGKEVFHFPPRAIARDCLLGLSSISPNSLSLSRSPCILMCVRRGVWAKTWSAFGQLLLSRFFIFVSQTGLRCVLWELLSRDSLSLLPATPYIVPTLHICFPVWAGVSAFWQLLSGNFLHLSPSVG